MSDASRLMWGGTIWLEESLYRQLDPTLTEGGRRKLELLMAEIIVCGPVKIKVYRQPPPQNTPNDLTPKV